MFGIKAALRHRWFPNDVAREYLLRKLPQLKICSSFPEQNVAWSLEEPPYTYARACYEYYCDTPAGKVLLAREVVYVSPREANGTYHARYLRNFNHEAAAALEAPYGHPALEVLDRMRPSQIFDVLHEIVACQMGDSGWWWKRNNPPAGLEAA